MAENIDSLQEKAMAARTAEELMAVAQEAGEDMTLAEAEEALQALGAAGKNGDARELSDEDLSDAVGGRTTWKGHLVVTGFYDCDLWEGPNGMEKYKGANCIACIHYAYKFPCGVCMIR